MSQAHPFDLTGKVAVVTGAGSGLGREMSLALAEAGAEAVCVDIDFEAAQKTASAVEHIGQSGMAIGCDVSSEEQVASAIDEAHRRCGRLDILVNNAGIVDPVMSPVGSYESASWQRIIEVNLNSVFYGCKAVLPIMEDQGSGKIINVASIFGLVGGSLVGPSPGYSATKGAVVNLTREMALEYATKNIQVNALCPGFFRTDLGGGAFDDPAFVEAVTAVTPMERIADVSEIRGPALFLASEASSFMTGHMLVVDGGVVAR